MVSRNVELPSQTRTLTSADFLKEIPGFIKRPLPQGVPGQMAKVLASGYLKFTQEGQRLLASDAVQHFIDLSQLHIQLTEEAKQFLQGDVPLMYEDQPIQPLLLNFALYRLKQTTQQYHMSVLQCASEATLKELHSTIKQQQAEYDAIIALG